MDLDSNPQSNLTYESSRVPIRQADAPMAGRTTNRIRAVGTMNADALFVQTNPDNPDRITGTGRDSIKMAASPPVIQHSFVPAENRHSRDFHYFPGANRGRQTL